MFFSYVHFDELNPNHPFCSVTSKSLVIMVHNQEEMALIFKFIQPKGLQKT